MATTQSESMFMLDNIFLISIQGMWIYNICYIDEQLLLMLDFLKNLN
jgi:hypothetical protein